MKGNDTLNVALNILLADELTAINQYMIYSEMCVNRGNARLLQAMRQQAMNEIFHPANRLHSSER